MSECKIADRERERAFDNGFARLARPASASVGLYYRATNQRGLAAASAVGCWMEKAQYRRIVEAHQRVPFLDSSAAATQPTPTSRTVKSYEVIWNQRFMLDWLTCQRTYSHALVYAVQTASLTRVHSPPPPPPPCSDHDHEPVSQARRPLEARRAQRGQNR